jgi:hypothetical protein
LSDEPLVHHRGQRASVGTLLTLINGVLAGVVGVYVSAHSVLVTVVAGIMAIAVAAMVLIFPK